MGELGDQAQHYHEALAEDIAASGASTIILVGDEMAHTAAKLKDGLDQGRANIACRQRFGSADRGRKKSQRRRHPFDQGVKLFGACQGRRGFGERGVLMFYLLAQWLEFEGIFNVFRYLSFRSGAAVATALFIGMLIGPRFINMLRMRQGKGQPIREDGPVTHL